MSENESYSIKAKKQLPFLIRDGFLMIVSGLLITALIIFQEWNQVLFLLPFLLLVLGLVELIVAWHIRQGLVYVRFVRMALGIVFMLKLKNRK